MQLTFVRNIGQGGFGIVDHVVDEKGQAFARKTFQINQGPGFPKNLEDNVKKRFIREAITQYEMKHKNIVPVIYEDTQAEPPYFLMPLALESLDKCLSIDRTLGGQYMRPLLDIMAALEELHSIKRYHRDLKPGNVLRFSSPEGDYYAVGDFGFMSLNQTQLSSLTQTGMKMGSDYYTAPEIVKDLRKASPQSDIYSIGCILHDMIGTEDRVPCGEIIEKGHFAGILRNCTRKDPKRRFKSIAALRDTLLSIGLPDEKAETATGQDILSLLLKEADLTDEEWDNVIDFIEDQKDTYDSKTVIKAIRLEKIKILIQQFKEKGIRLGFLYAEFVRNGTFPFEDCDGLATRLEGFIINTPDEFDLHVDCMMALLYMGTSHNRWFVEQKFTRLAGKDCNENLAKLLAIEFRTDEAESCYAIRHLRSSINFNLENLHPKLFKTFQEICGR